MGRSTLINRFNRIVGRSVLLRVFPAARPDQPVGRPAFAHTVAASVTAVSALSNSSRSVCAQTAQSLLRWPQSCTEAWVWHPSGRSGRIAVDGDPLAIETSYYPADLTPDLFDQPLDGSLWDLLGEKYGMRPARATATIEVVTSTNQPPSTSRSAPPPSASSSSATPTTPTAAASSSPATPGRPSRL